MEAWKSLIMIGLMITLFAVTVWFTESVVLKFAKNNRADIATGLCIINLFVGWGVVTAAYLHLYTSFPFWVMWTVIYVVGFVPSMIGSTRVFKWINRHLPFDKY